jgi:hypothetical protein
LMFCDNQEFFVACEGPATARFGACQSYCELDIY